MDNWNSYYSSNDSQDSGLLKSASYYTENYRKKKKRKPGILFQMVIVAIISSILGGALVGSFFVYVAPNIQTIAKGYVQNNNIKPGDQDAQRDSSDGPYQSTSNSKEVLVVGESPVTKVAEMVSPSIVGIRSLPKQRTNNNFGFFFFQELPPSPSEGSGIIIKSDGYILTNYHVIQNVLDSTGQLSEGAKIEVYLPNQMDKPYDAKVVDWDRKTDLAVIKIAASELPEAVLGDSDKLKVGEIAVAIGNPGGLEYMGSVTSGVISGLNRTVYVEDRELKLIQTDAAINPGNSGGALCNAKGEVIGVNTVKLASVGFEGLGFAIPINTAKEVAESLINKTPIGGRAPVIGVQIDPRYTEEVAKEFNTPVGLYIYDVTFMSGAYKAGLRTGDIITEFDGKRVKTFDELQEIKNKHKPGDVVKVKVYRNKEYMEVELTLGEDRW